MKEYEVKGRNNLDELLVLDRTEQPIQEEMILFFEIMNGSPKRKRNSERSSESFSLKVLNSSRITHK